MSYPSQNRRAGVIARALFSGTAGLLAVAASTGSLVAQQLQAHYPLINDLDDATMINGPVMLLGTTPPAQPNNGLCLNGIYLFSGNPLGQDARTPIIATLDANDFQLEVEFQVASLPAFNSPIVVGGSVSSSNRTARWACCTTMRCKSGRRPRSRWGPGTQD